MTDADTRERTESVTGLDLSQPGKPRAQRFVLKVLQGADQGTRWSSQGARCAIGSHPSNDLVLKDPTVSRFHCELILDPEGAVLRDLSSRNGTFVDSLRAREVLLHDQCVVRLADTTIQFRWGDGQTELPVSEAHAFGRLVGRSITMRSVFYLLGRAAESDATVLMEGETGTGKDAAAEAVHLASTRKDQPFVVVDCGSIPRDLIESELFGHERGAFTGAVERHVGAFEQAAGGTVFLDELGELPVDLQPRLLRVLEQRTVRRVGGSERILIDVRLIAATNRSLREAVNAGTFRSDLYFRLAVIQVRLPPLRERLEDLPLLVGAMLDSMDAHSEAIRSLLSEEFFARLRSSLWPGNVRELRNYLEQCIVLEQPPPLEGDADRPVTREFELGLSYETERRRALDLFERRYARWLVDQHKGNITAAATSAGISRRYLHRLLERHGK